MDARLPITPLILGKLVNALEHTTSSPFLRALLRAMFILAFLRVGEITKLVILTKISTNLVISVLAMIASPKMY